MAPVNTLDHRTLAAESWGDVVTGIMAGVLLANPPLDLVAPEGSTYAYGAGAGTTPTAFTTQPQFSVGANALRGTVFFNTGGSTPAGGIVLTVTFPVAVPIANADVKPYIYIAGVTTTANANGPNVLLIAVPVIVSGACTGFALRAQAAITASQGSATAAGFAVSWLLIP